MVLNSPLSMLSRVILDVIPFVAVAGPLLCCATDLHAQKGYITDTIAEIDASNRAKEEQRREAERQAQIEAQRDLEAAAARFAAAAERQLAIDPAFAEWYP